jgi:hypothetical protein
MKFYGLKQITGFLTTGGSVWAECDGMWEKMCEGCKCVIPS